MFRLEFYVDDKHLAKVLTEISSYAMNLKTQPVLNAEVVTPKVPKSRALVPVASVEPKVGGNATTYRRVFERIKLHKVKGDRVTSVEIQEAMKAEKVSDNTYSFIVRNLKDQNLIGSLQRGIFVIKAAD